MGMVYKVRRQDRSDYVHLMQYSPMTATLRNLVLFPPQTQPYIVTLLNLLPGKYFGVHLIVSVDIGDSASFRCTCYSCTVPQLQPLELNTPLFHGYSYFYQCYIGNLQYIRISLLYKINCVIVWQQYRVGFLVGSLHELVIRESCRHGLLYCMKCTWLLLLSSLYSKFF